MELALGDGGEHVVVGRAAEVALTALAAFSVGGLGRGGEGHAPIRGRDHDTLADWRLDRLLLGFGKAEHWFTRG